MMTMQSILIGALIGLIISLVLYSRAKKIKWSNIDQAKPKRLLSFYSELNPCEALHTIIDFAKSNSLNIEKIEESIGHVVISDSPTCFSYGFFYPIYITSSNTRSTFIEVGIKPRISMLGPLVTHYHNKFFKLVRHKVEQQVEG